MKRRRPPVHQVGQTDLFASQALSWAARHWPGYAVGSAVVPERSPLALWAATIESVPAGSRLLLEKLCELAADDGLGASSIAELAAKTCASQNATRTRLDRLLAADLVLIRPRVGPRPTGYVFQIVVDEEQRTKAIKAGFLAKRSSGSARERANG